MKFVTEKLPFEWIPDRALPGTIISRILHALRLFSIARRPDVLDNKPALTILVHTFEPNWFLSATPTGAPPTPLLNDANPFRFYEDQAQDYGLMILAWLSEQPKGSYPDSDHARDELGLDPIQFEMGMHWCRRRGYWTLFLPNPNAYGPFDDDEPSFGKRARKPDAEEDEDEERSAWKAIGRAREAYLDLLKIQLDDVDEKAEDEDDEASETAKDDEDDEDEAPPRYQDARRFRPEYRREDSNPFLSPARSEYRRRLLSGGSSPGEYCRFSEFDVEQKFIDRELKIAVLTLVISLMSTWLIIEQMDGLNYEQRSSLAVVIFIGTGMSMFLASVFVLLRPHRDKDKTDQENG
ncbi:MAG: hypothetical protein GXY36_08155 [Chloroflexi bacterium]|nr:hypothetical protein [Chloroflexota bacterium]